MIFVTVGTHEQGMNRLFKELDRLKENHLVRDDIFAQIGYSSYIPQYFEYKQMIGYQQMDYYIKKAKIVITHGGPGSIFHPLQYGKIPIVVPRNPKFNEHVDDHQILFTNRLEKENRVLAVYDISNLKNTINNYDDMITKCINRSNDNSNFIKNFNNLICKLMEN